MCDQQENLSVAQNELPQVSMKMMNLAKEHSYCNRFYYFQKNKKIFIDK
jgi:hypothetical protein